MSSATQTQTAHPFYWFWHARQSGVLLLMVGAMLVGISAIAVSHPPLTQSPAVRNSTPAESVQVADSAESSGWPKEADSTDARTSPTSDSGSMSTMRPPSGPSLQAHPLVNRGGSGRNVGAAGDMIGFTHSDDSGSQTITLVDTSKSWMAVYHIDRSGKIRLVSSRPLQADFSLQLNATEPLPEDIRQLGRP